MLEGVLLWSSCLVDQFVGLFRVSGGWLLVRECCGWLVLDCRLMMVCVFLDVRDDGNSPRPRHRTKRCHRIEKTKDASKDDMLRSSRSRDYRIEKLSMLGK